MSELSWDALGTWSQSESIIARLEELSHSFCRTRRTEADFADFAPGQLGVLKRVLDYKSQQSIELFRRNKLQEQLAAISFHLSNGQRWKQNSSLIRVRFLKSN
jgi:hypothetical protein